MSVPSPPDGLPITGERTVPGLAYENYWFRRHEVAYAWAVAQLPQQPSAGWVLDAGCGEGYGTSMLRAAGHAPLAVDYDVATTDHVRSRYGTPTLRANLVALPLADAVVSAVVSLQVVEHLWDQAAYARECARVLRPGGIAVVSTPNRLTFSPGWTPGARPDNIFHTTELAAGDLLDLLAPHLTSVGLYGVHHGSALRSLDDRLGGIVAAQLAGPPASWAPELTRAVAGVRRDDFAVVRDSPAYPLADSLDLVALGRRR